MNRLWDSAEDNMSPHIHPIKVTVKKPSTKGAKAKSVEKVSVEQFSPAMVLLLLLLQENESIVFVIVLLKVSMTVPVTVTFPNLIATSDGIHPVPVFIMDTIYTCWLLLLQKATFLFFLC